MKKVSLSVLSVAVTFLALEMCVRLYAAVKDWDHYSLHLTYGTKYPHTIWGRILENYVEYS